MVLPTAQAVVTFDVSAGPTIVRAGQTDGGFNVPSIAVNPAGTLIVAGIPNGVTGNAGFSWSTTNGATWTFVSIAAAPVGTVFVEFMDDDDMFFAYGGGVLRYHYTAPSTWTMTDSFLTTGAAPTQSCCMAFDYDPATQEAVALWDRTTGGNYAAYSLINGGSWTGVDLAASVATCNTNNAIQAVAITAPGKYVYASDGIVKYTADRFSSNTCTTPRSASMYSGGGNQRGGVEFEAGSGNANYYTSSSGNIDKCGGTYATNAWASGGCPFDITPSAHEISSAALQGVTPRFVEGALVYTNTAHAIVYAPTNQVLATNAEHFAVTRDSDGVWHLVYQAFTSTTSGADFTYLQFNEVESETPDAPAGLLAIVLTSALNPAHTEIQLFWPVSANDPDQEQGDFTYEVDVDGLFTTPDDTTALDNDGLRYSLIVLSINTYSNINFRVRAVNATTSIAGGWSCTVTVNEGIPADTDECGDTTPFGGGGFGGGGTEFTTPTDTAAGLRGWCADLMGDSGGSLFLCGLMLVAGAYIAMAAAFGALGGKGMPALVAGSVGGLGVAIFNIIAEVWGLVFGIVLIIISAAIVIWLARKLTGLQAGASTG